MTRTLTSVSPKTTCYNINDMGTSCELERRIAMRLVSDKSVAPARLAV